MTETIAQHLREAEHRLAAVSPSARLDAELLLARAIARDRVWLRAHDDHIPASDQLSCFEYLLSRRERGEPVAYLLGERGFWDLTLAVTADTLIPRPDTETLVERALERLPHAGTVLDLGTGSGAIALAIRSARPDASVTAVDASLAALAVAFANADRLGLPVECLASDWFSAVQGRRFNLVVSNPPYIDAGDPHLTVGDVAFEPRSALVSGADGLDDLRHIVSHAPQHLHPGGWLLVEHGYRQGDAVRQLFTQAGFSRVETCRDFGDNDRVTLGVLGDG